MTLKVEILKIFKTNFNVFDNNSIGSKFQPSITILKKMTLKFENLPFDLQKFEISKKIKTSFNVFRTVLCQNFSPLLMTLKFSKIDLEKIGIKKKPVFSF